MKTYRGGIIGLWYDFNPFVNWVDWLNGFLFAARMVLAGRGVASVWLPADLYHENISVDDVRREWKRLGVPSAVLYMRNTGMLLLVPASQRRWAEYVVARLRCRERIPAWSEQERRSARSYDSRRRHRQSAPR